MIIDDTSGNLLGIEIPAILRSSLATAYVASQFPIFRICMKEMIKKYKDNNELFVKENKSTRNILQATDFFWSLSTWLMKPLEESKFVKLHIKINVSQLQML